MHVITAEASATSLKTICFLCFSLDTRYLIFLSMRFTNGSHLP